MDFFLLNVLNALQLSMLIFLLAVGLTLIFGLMDTLNLAHGAFYTIGAYTGWQISAITGNYYIAFFLAPLLVGLLGGAIQAFVLQPLTRRGRSIHLDFALLTFGLLFFVMGLLEIIFGPRYDTIELPELLQGGIAQFGISFPIYRIFIILLGVFIFLVLWAVIEKTNFGTTLRAGVENREMTVSMGINIDNVFIQVFALGCALAGLAGVIAAPIFGVFSHMGGSILVITFIVVVVGGLGNFKGSFYASIMIGFIETFTQAYLPSVQVVAIYVVLILAMMFRPQGIFSRVKPGSN